MMNIIRQLGILLFIGIICDLCIVLLWGSLTGNLSSYLNGSINLKWHLWAGLIISNAIFGRILEYRIFLSIPLSMVIILIQVFVLYTLMNTILDLDFFGNDGQNIVIKSLSFLLMYTLQQTINFGLWKTFGHLKLNFTK